MMDECESYSDEYFDGYQTGEELAKQDFYAQRRADSFDLCNNLGIPPNSDFGQGLREGHHDYFFYHDLEIKIKSDSACEIERS